MTMATIENIFSLNDTVFDARHEEYAEEETSIGVSKDVEEHFKGIMDRHNMHAPSTVDMVLFYIETVLTRQSEMANTSPCHIPVLGNVPPPPFFS